MEAAEYMAAAHLDPGAELQFLRHPSPAEDGDVIEFAMPLGQHEFAHHVPVDLAGFAVELHAEDIVDAPAGPHDADVRSSVVRQETNRYVLNNRKRRMTGSRVRRSMMVLRIVGT